MTALESLIRRDRWLVGGALAVLTAICWLYLVDMTAMLGGMDMNAMVDGMSMIRPWTASDFAVMFAMWVIMMVGMMLPSASPMILLYARIVRKNAEKGHVLTPTGVFAAGYLAAWTGFSMAATVLQWTLDQLALLSPMMVSASPYLGGGLLIAAGLYQLTPLKNACLVHCRTPLHFLSSHWRRGRGGAFLMGAHHGLYCVGCCWVLMALLFVFGVMTLWWIAALAIVVLVEKVAPAGEWFGRVGGLLLIAYGIYFLADA